jgi:gamma-glutamyltranspeptidase / glutathione hydrolase
MPGGGAIATSHPEATRIGAAVLRANGSAVDAAVAAAWALAVCEPSGSGFGGQAGLLVRTPAGTLHALDGQAHAPRGTRRGTVSAAEQRRGARATTVPTMPAVLGRAHARWGVLPWARVLDPAIVLAGEGYTVTPAESRRARWVAPLLREDPATAAAYLPRGRAPRPGSTLRLPGLCATLTRVAQDGSEDVYRGRIAHGIVADQDRRDGLMDAADLASAYDVPVEEVLEGPHGAARVATMPTAGGATLLLALEILRRLAPTGGALDWSLAIARATRSAQAVRDRLDPADPRSGLDERTVSAACAEILTTPAPWTVARPGSQRDGPGDTTHIVTVDDRGGIASLTSSIQSLYGAKVVCGELGFLYNNYLRTCTRRPGPYRLGPGCRPRSNAAPTIVLDADEPVLVAGSAGSRRITSSLLHVLSGVLDRGMPVRDAVEHPRAHLLASGHLWLERSAVPAGTAVAGPRVDLRPDLHHAMGAVNAIARTAAGWEPAADPRRGGVALAVSGGAP